jgi:acetylornithine deacetylase/succinyl-diaminopimelate desuccinylase-like protein
LRLAEAHWDDTNHVFMEAVLNYLDKNQERFVAELCEYVRFASVSAQPQHRADVQACAQWLTRHCQSIGLRAKCHRTTGHPIVTATTFTRRDPNRPHFVVYGHYDVQPVDPLNLWHSPPFEPRVARGRIYGRGTSDNKGQHLAHLKAVEAYLRTDTNLPCDLTFLIEGEEEIGGDSLETFLRQHRRELECEAFVISDSGIPGLRYPALTYALRGIAALEVRLEGPSRDLHSGIYGGSLENPAAALCQMLASLHDKHGRVNIPGFYDAVQPLSEFERKALARIPHSDREYRRFLGVPALFGEKGFTSLEQRSARPTLEINGLTSGYQGEGSKTIIPAWASAKLTMRLVPRQTPERILALTQKHLRRICPRTVRISLMPGHSGEPYWVSPHDRKAEAALRALRTAFGCRPILMREGGSIPIVNQFKKLLGADSLLLGLALPDDGAHSPNEKFDLRCYALGMRLGAFLWPELCRK